MKKIESKRTALRRLDLSDLGNIQILEADPLVMKFTPSVPQSKEQSMKRLEGWVNLQDQLEPFGIWAAEFKAESSFVGWFMLKPIDSKQLELGFMIVRDHWKKGLTTEICRELIDFVQSQQNVEMIIAKANPENSPSIRVLEKLGFQFTENIFVPDKYSDGQIQVKLFKLKIADKKF